jgi:hypothetical protein
MYATHHRQEKNHFWSFGLRSTSCLLVFCEASAGKCRVLLYIPCRVADPDPHLFELLDSDPDPGGQK